MPKNTAKNKTDDTQGAEAVQTVQPTHQMPEGLKAFKDAQRAGTAGQDAPEALVVDDKTPQVKQVTVKCLENGSFRVGQQYFGLSKGKNTVLPENVAEQFRRNKLVE